MNNNRTITILILIFFAIVAIIIILLAIGGLAGNTPPSQSIEPSPQATEQTPTLAYIPQNQIQYQPGSFDKYIQNANNQNSVSQSDADARKKLVDSLGDNSGILNQTDTYAIYYRSVSDVLDIDITTTNIALAKQQATDWLTSQGLSLDGICKFPTSFYLDPVVQEQFKDTTVTFNPLPDGC